MHLRNNFPLAQKFPLSSCTGPDTPHLNFVRGSPVQFHAPGSTKREADRKEGLQGESAITKCLKGAGWDSGALGKLQGEGKAFLKLG